MAKASKKSAKSSGKARKASSKRAKGESSGNGKKLVVVESPAKAKTINRYLGNDYTVKASMGHVRDLPAKQIGVDFEHGFEPTYEPLTGRRKVLAELKKAARNAPQVFLATDLDREGEAIAWHLAESLGVKGDVIRRVIFNEITPSAIKAAFEHPSGLDMNKVNAQQARRILDRIVGYQVSPLLWRKVSPGLSAGRVQSVAVRLIVEREREIDAFTPEEYWKISAIFTPDLDQADDIARQWARFLSQEDDRGMGPNKAAQLQWLAEHNAFTAELTKLDGKRWSTDQADNALTLARQLGLIIDDEQRTEDPDAKGPAKNKVVAVGHIAGHGDENESAPEYTVRNLRRRESKSRPPAPLITSTMQQAASVRLRYSASRTMQLAQQLYEGIDIPGEGHVGLITYMRTDSRHLSRDAVNMARSFISERFGQQYIPSKPNVFTSGKRAQEAHEAIRPTDVSRRPEDLEKALTPQQLKLYRLIWRQFVACQMTPAVWTVTEADIMTSTPGGEVTLRAMGRTIKFDGYLRVAGMPTSGDQILPPLEEGQPVGPVELKPTQHFTQPPPRFTEASLVKALEAENIGRPSTYASIIKTIQDRKYVEQQNRSFHPTDLGIVVTDKLVKHFPNVFDTRFTAKMEDELDRIEDSSADWVKVLEEFYGPFSNTLEKAKEEMVHAKAETEPSEYTCEKCGKEMVYRFSKNGRYLACTGYPDCKQTHPVDKDGKKIEKQVSDVACPECEAPMLLRRGRYGPFLSCSRYPDCKGVVNLDKKGNIKHPSPPPLLVEDIECTKCGAPLNLRRGKRGPWLSCSKFPKCRGRVGWTKLEEAKQKELEERLVRHESEHPVPQVTRIDGTVVGESEPPRILAPDEVPAGVLDESEEKSDKKKS
ncbi:MAG: type I DNA topoisomerase [Phycisphaerae bacterium]